MEFARFKAKALFPERAPPVMKISLAGDSPDSTTSLHSVRKSGTVPSLTPDPCFLVLNPLPRRHPFFIWVLLHIHLCDVIGHLNKPIMGLASCHDHFKLLRLVLQEADDFLHSKPVSGHRAVYLIHYQ